MNLKTALYVTLTVCVLGLGVSSAKASDLVSNALIEYRNFPKAGINFYDVSGVLSNPTALKTVIDNLAEHYKNKQIDVILAVDSRGFLFATPLAYKLNIPVVMLRKPGKLPGKTISSGFSKEYGKDVLEMQEDALRAGQRVIIIDDLIATGGTFKAAIKLARQAAAEVVEVTAIVELSEFKNSRDLDVNVYSVVKK